MVNPTKLNDYLKDSMDDLSAKVFRTYNASVTLQEELQKGNFDDEQTSVEQKVKYYEDCNRKVAILCNH
jgi:DNA topoisomerase-1